MYTYVKGKGWIILRDGVSCVDRLGRKRILYARAPRTGEPGFSCGVPGEGNDFTNSDGTPNWDMCIKHVADCEFSSESTLVHWGHAKNDVCVTVLFA